jgi:hypothetical protein
MRARRGQRCAAGECRGHRNGAKSRFDANPWHFHDYLSSLILLPLPDFQLLMLAGCGRAPGGAVRVQIPFLTPLLMGEVILRGPC